MAQSRDSRPERLCWRLSYRNGIITLILRALPPMEAMIGLDAALKAADVTMKVFYGPPSETNFAGGLLTGDQAACKAACRAFAASVRSTAESPLQY